MKVLERLRTWARRKLRDPEMPYVTPPPWIARYVVDFLILHPQACRGDWQTFATMLAGRAFEDGFRVGWEAKAFGVTPEVHEDIVVADALAGQDLSGPVPIQVPAGYENVVFVNENGVPNVRVE